MFISSPNSVVDHGKYYISYNARDCGIYGGETTALVIGQMEKFYILMGDHRTDYARLAHLGLDACLDYFRSNMNHAHKFSDRLTA